MSETTITTYPTEAEWLEARRLSVGASEAAAFLTPEEGRPAWASPYKLWTEKKLGISPAKNDPWLRIATALEPVIANLYIEETGYTVLRYGFNVARNPKYPFLHASLDGLAEIAGEIAKCLEFKAPRDGEVWEGAPIYYRVQGNVTILVVEIVDHEIVPLFPGVGIRRYPTIPDEELQKKIVDRVGEFHARYILGNEEPPVDDSEATAKALNQRYPKAEDRTIELPGDAALWIGDFEEAGAKLKLLEEQAKPWETRRAVAKAQLKRVMGDAQRAELRGKNGEVFAKVNWYEVAGGQVNYTLKPRRDMRITIPKKTQ